MNFYARSTLASKRLAEAIANLLGSQLDHEPVELGMTYGVSIAEGSATLAVKHVSYEDEVAEFHVRLNSGTYQIVRVYEAGQQVPTENNIGTDRVRQSYLRFKVLQDNAVLITKVAEISFQDADAAIQGWHDEIMTDEQRQDWNRWISGGYATQSEWRMVQDLKHG